MKNEELINSVKNKILYIEPSAKVILFGSRARGDFKKNSDWDFLILTDSNIDKEKKKMIRDSLVNIEIDAEETISTLIYSQNQWDSYKFTPLFYYVSKEGIPL